jgi:hypothetical protein
LLILSRNTQINFLQTFLTIIQNNKESTFNFIVVYAV